MTAEVPSTPAPAKFGDYLELTKPRLSLLSVITALVGYLASRPPFLWVELLSVIIGTSLAAGGVASLNQWMEAETDARMKRTAERPIPAGRVAPGSAFVLGWLMCVAGIGIIFSNVNGLSAFFTLATIASALTRPTPLSDSASVFASAWLMSTCANATAGRSRQHRQNRNRRNSFIDAVWRQPRRVARWGPV